jgi:hypothetical protein
MVSILLLTSCCFSVKKALTKEGRERDTRILMPGVDCVCIFYKWPEIVRIRVKLNVQMPRVFVSALFNAPTNYRYNSEVVGWGSVDDVASAVVTSRLICIHTQRPAYIAYHANTVRFLMYRMPHTVGGMGLACNIRLIEIHSGQASHGALQILRRQIWTWYEKGVRSWYLEPHFRNFYCAMCDLGMLGLLDKSLGLIPTPNIDGHPELQLRRFRDAQEMPLGQ